MNLRREATSSVPTELKPGDTEFEMGVPIPGVILEQSQWAQTALKKLPEEGLLNLETLFGRIAPTVLEVGCGNGRFTLSSALRRPECNHIAIDILPAVVRYATRRANQRGLSNVRVAVCDGWRFLSNYLAVGSIDEIHIYHPQPYADPRDAGKRMMTPDFIALMHSRLIQGGKVFLQTDREAYWNYMRQVMLPLFDWEELTEPWPEDPHGRSRREMLSVGQELTIFRSVATRKSGLEAEEIQRLTESSPLPQFQVERKKKPYRRKRR